MNFALGKAYADIGDYDNSFASLIDGNRLRKEQLTSVASTDRELFAGIKSIFAKSIPALNISKTLEDTGVKRPIFVLGMPRSGTTLVEQILASHSHVFANLKTWLIGIHHGVSHQHLQAYLNEFTFRFNRRFYPFNAFRSLLGIAGDTSAPTYAELYSGEWRHPTCSGHGR